MPTTTSLTTTYAGRVAGGYIRQAFKANTTINAITFRDNIAYKEVVRRLVDNITFAAPTCDFTPTGTVTLTERVLTLEGFEVARQLCKKDFFTDWGSKEAQDGTLTQDLIDAMIDNMLAGIADNNERIIWQGVNATAGEYAGFETLFAADATVIDASNDAVITKSNVLTKLEEVVGLMPSAVKSATVKPRLYVATNVAEAYQNKQADLGNNNLYQQGAAISMTWLGRYEIVECPGMKNNSIVFAQPTNLWFGTNVLADWNEIGFLDMKELDLSDNVRFKARFFAGVQYGFGNEIVYYAHTPA